MTQFSSQSDRFRREYFIRKKLELLHAHTVAKMLYTEKNQIRTSFFSVQPKACVYIYIHTEVKGGLKNPTPRASRG